MSAAQRRVCGFGMAPPNGGAQGLHDATETSPA
jgi:hypothetical protein